MPIVRFFIDEMKKKYTEIKKSSKIRESKVKERGVKNLADYFGLTELIKELGSIEKELICLFFFIYSSLLNFRF